MTASIPQRLCLSVLLVMTASSALADECVILLHGLARTAESLGKMESALIAAGYRVANIDYPSREATIELLAPTVLKQGLSECRERGADQVSVVTHSMGGILVRYYLQEKTIANLHRVVMLAPPNQGSAVVDAFRHVPGYAWLNGPAGLQLGTDDDSVPLALGPVGFELGIIAGNRTINPILSQFLDNPDDGKVSVASTRVEGMCAFIELPATHAMIMRNDTVIDEVLAYLASGIFAGAGAENGLC